MVFDRRTTMWIAALAAVIFPPMASAADWPQYRGPNRDGISAETGILRSWPEAGPPELWRKDFGAGFAGMAVVGGRLYSGGSDEANDFAFCLDAVSGEELWRTDLGPKFTNSFGDGPRTTPTIAGESAYVVSGQGQLKALDIANGEVRWDVDLKERFGVEQLYFGFSTAPLVLGDLVLLEVGGEGSSLVAFDRSSGEERWRAAAEGEAAYNSPVQVDFGGVEQLVYMNRENVVSVTPEGRVVWTHPFAPGEGVKPALPIFVEPDLIFVSASYDIGAMAIRMKAEGDALNVEEVWKSKVMRNHFNSSVLLDGHLYGFDNSTFKCIDPATGEQKWAKRGRMGKGSLIYADGHLLVLTETGRLLLVEVSPEAYVEKAGVDVLTGRCWTSPTLADGRLYLRNRDEMVAIDLRAETEPAEGP